MRRKELLTKCGGPVSGIFLTLLLLSGPVLTLSIQSVRANPETMIVPDNYQTIQEAINHANEGDTIYVRNGTYYENVIVNKTVSLIGENRSATIVDGGGAGRVIRVVADNVTIKGFTIRNSGYATYDGGIWITSSGNKVINNEIKDNSWGVGLAYPGVYSILSGNNISGQEHSYGSWGGGIILMYSNNNTIIGNAISCYEDNGIYMWGASNSNYILGNTLKNHFVSGIHFSGSNNFIHHNNFMETRSQVLVTQGDVNVWDDGYPSGGNYWSDYDGTDLFGGPHQNETGGDGIGDTPYIISENNTDNYPLMQPHGSIRNMNTGLSYLTIQSAINANETLDGHTIHVSSGTYYEHVVVNKTISLIGENRNNTVIDGRSTGNIMNITANNVNIASFTIQKSGSLANSGIHVSSNGNNISYNTITNNKYGIWLYNSSQNTVSSNNVFSNTDYGIYLNNSDNNTVSGNTASRNVHGIYVSTSSNIVISGNNVSLNDGFGIVLVSSVNNTVSGNIASHNVHGVYLDYYSNDNTVFGNTASNNFYGISIDYYSNDNTVFGNTASNNFYGIYLFRTNNIIVFHNNLVDNTQQAYSRDSTSVWDDGQEGNYWYDYNGTDFDGDGIGDTPYIVDESNQDNYPLMNPYWNPADINHDLKVDIYDVVLVAGAYGSTPSDPNWNPHSDIAEPYGIIDIFDVVVVTGSYGEKWSYL